MATYKEHKENLNLILSDSDKPVKIKITCYYGTTVKLTTSVTDYEILQCGDLQVLGSAEELKGKNIRFDGICKNPSGQSIKIKHNIYEVGGDEVTYIFPEEFTGT
ncbi:MAG: hypothetical protein EHM20_10330, partial [Alphaproteobacteria bacterium]